MSLTNERRERRNDNKDGGFIGHRHTQPSGKRDVALPVSETTPSSSSKCESLANARGQTEIALQFHFILEIQLSSSGCDSLANAQHAQPCSRPLIRLLRTTLDDRLVISHSITAATHKSYHVTSRHGCENGGPGPVPLERKLVWLAPLSSRSKYMYHAPSSPQSKKRS